tara:strand:- start:1050 stop:1454 length:405 start_codon:yes stop_codon:yes gene_type:complete
MSRLLGIDYGDTRIGIATSDPLKIISKPMTTLVNNDDFLTNLEKIIIDKNVEAIIVGYPIGMKGQRTPQTEKVDDFVDILKNKFDLDVITVDERLSSISATNSLVKQGIKTGHNKGMIDDTSAAIILQEYLDGR